MRRRESAKIISMHEPSIGPATFKTGQRLGRRTPGEWDNAGGALLCGIEGLDKLLNMFDAVVKTARFEMSGRLPLSPFACGCTLV